MTKTQYQTIIKDIKDRYSHGYRLRLNLRDGNWVQGQAQLLGSDTLIVVDDNTKNPAYVDLAAVVQITVG